MGWEGNKTREVHGRNYQYIQLVKTSFSVQVLELDIMSSHCKLFKLVLGNLGQITPCSETHFLQDQMVMKYCRSQ